MKKRFLWLLCASLFLCYSCVEKTYDLNKDISMDVTITGNKITLPVSNLKPIILDSLIDVNDVDILEKMNGIYCLKKEDTIDPIDLEIDTIKINIDPINYNTTFQFDEVTIEEAVLNKVVKEQTFKVESVSIDDLNESLPTLRSKVERKLYTSEIEQKIQELKELGSNAEYSIPLVCSTTTGEEKVHFDLNYILPKEVKDINEITLNNLISFKITNPEILNGINKNISFKVTFPEEFILSLYNNATDADKYRLSSDKRTIEVSGIDTKEDELLIQFYIDKMVGLKAVDGKISFDDYITYQVDYNVNNNVTVSANTNLEEFKFIVTLEHKVNFEDAKGATNDIDVTFAEMNFDFSAHFDNLKHIQKVEYIDFDANNSKITFTTDLEDGGFAPFNLKEGYQLKLSFPENFVLDIEKCVYPEGVTYNETQHAFFITDINILHQFEWQLAIDTINVYTDVIDNHCDLNTTASISVASSNDSLKLGETKLESLNSTLKNLKSKQVVFTMAETHLHIDEAVVKTETIHENIEEHASFTINEKIDEGVRIIESVEFTEEVPVTLDVNMSGLDGIDTDIHLKLDATIPSFLVLESSDERVKIDGNKLSVNADYNPQDKILSIPLRGKRIIFGGEEFPNGMELKDSTDNNRYLIYDQDVPIIGEAYIDETEMHSNILGKDITLNVDFKISEIEVKKFNGIYCGKIDDIHETIDFDLGEELDFLKDEINTITLSDPQIMFTIDNPVGIPVDLALSMYGKDDNGNIIDSSRVETNIRLEPALYNYDNEKETGEVITLYNKFLLTNKPTKLDGYTNIVISNLSDLLKRIPSTLDIELIPTIDESETHHVDLSKELVFHPSYEVIVPLKFENIHIEYTDSLEDLNEDLGEAMEHISNIEVKAYMNVRNTIPVGLTLTIEPIDLDGNLIENIEIEEVNIAAGNGEDINEGDSSDNNGEERLLTIKSYGKVLQRLDKLRLIINGDADETVGGKPLTPKQGVHITNVTLEIIGDIDTNLEEL